MILQLGVFVASYGCIRLLNEDVADLCGRVHVGTRVIMEPRGRRCNNVGIEQETSCSM